MPIHPSLRSRYHPRWERISFVIRAYRAGWHCEFCDAGDWRLEKCDVCDEPRSECNCDSCDCAPERKSRVVLTVAHLDHDPANNERANLAALCQRCHNGWDAAHRAATRRARRSAATRPLFAPADDELIDATLVGTQCPHCGRGALKLVGGRRLQTRVPFRCEGCRRITAFERATVEAAGLQRPLPLDDAEWTLAKRGMVRGTSGVGPLQKGARGLAPPNGDGRFRDAAPSQSTPLGFEGEPAKTTPPKQTLPVPAARSRDAPDLDAWVTIYDRGERLAHILSIKGDRVAVELTDGTRQTIDAADVEWPAPLEPEFPA